MLNPHDERAADPQLADRRNADLDQIEIRMNSTGFPILLKIVMEKDLLKSEWEKLLRLFLTQHYCKSTFQRFNSELIRSDCVQTFAVDTRRDKYRTVP